MNDCENDPLDYFRGDELPEWEGTVTLNGVAPDLSVGWTFTVSLSMHGQTDVVVTSGITGHTGGVFVVAWPTGSLDIQPGDWVAQITGRRGDDAEFTERQAIHIKPRALAEA